jgi:hypothetical protein
MSDILNEEMRMMMDKYGKLEVLRAMLFILRREELSNTMEKVLKEAEKNGDSHRN